MDKQIRCGDIVQVKYFKLEGKVWYVNASVVSIETEEYPALTVPVYWVKKINIKEN